MLFLLSLVVQSLSRFLVGPRADDGSKDLEILVLRHQLRVLRRKTGPPKLRFIDRVLLAAASRSIPSLARRADGERGDPRPNSDSRVTD